MSYFIRSCSPGMIRFGKRDHFKGFLDKVLAALVQDC